MNRSFCISGFGRSGTRWLAELMNRSNVWTVRHEPTYEYDRDALVRRFRYQRNIGNYGEVNSFALYSLTELPVDHIGIIIRDPLDICVSAANKGHDLEGAFLDHLVVSLAVMDMALSRSDVLAISFKQMTTDVTYLKDLLLAFGIEDVEPTQDDLRSKVNAGGRDRLSCWLALWPKQRTTIERRLRWFRRKYVAEGAHEVFDPDVPTC